MKVLGLHADCSVFMDMRRGFTSGGTSNPIAERGKSDGRSQNI